MHAVTPRQYFSNIKLTWSIEKWPTLNAGSAQVLPWQHDILKFLIFSYFLYKNCKIVFIVFLKSTAGVMKNDVYSFVISHLILKLSHFLYFELWRHKYELR
jgi:hypothetical protein